MKEARLRILFSQLANLARYLTCYPLFLFCYSGVLKQQGYHSVAWETAAVVILAFASMFVTMLAHKICKRVLGVRLMQAVMVAISAVAGVFLCKALGGTVWMRMYAGIIFALYSAIGGLSAEHSLGRWEFFTAAGIFLFTVITLSVRGFDYPVTAFMVLFIVVAGLFALEYNFLNIDFLMRRRGHKMSHLPGRIRSFNLLLLLGGMVLVLVLVLCRSFFMDIAGTVFRALGAVLWFLLTPLRRFMNNEEFWNREIDMPEADWEADPDDAFEQLTDYEEKVVDTELQADLLVVLAVAVVLFVLIRYRKSIFESIAYAWNWLRKALATLMRSLGMKERYGEDENEYYTDVEQQISGEERTRVTTVELRAWKKQLKAYQKLPDGREKYLRGFALTARGLQLHGVAVKLSDTPLEILEKAGGILEPEGYRVAVQACNALAFSQGGEPAWPELQQALDTLRSRKSAK